MAKRLKQRRYMYRHEFSAALGQRLGVDTQDADEIAAAFIDVLTTAWSEGRTVCFPHFGVFELHVITQKMGRNPKTMQPYEIPASYKPAFRPTKDLRDAVSRLLREQLPEDAPVT